MTGTRRCVRALGLVALFALPARLRSQQTVDFAKLLSEREKTALVANAEATALIGEMKRSDSSMKATALKLNDVQLQIALGLQRLVAHQRTSDDRLARILVLLFPNVNPDTARPPKGEFSQHTKGALTYLAVLNVPKELKEEETATIRLAVYLVDRSGVPTFATQRAPGQRALAKTREDSWRKAEPTAVVQSFEFTTDDQLIATVRNARLTIDLSEHPLSATADTYREWSWDVIPKHQLERVAADTLSVDLPGTVLTSGSMSLTFPVIVEQRSGFARGYARFKRDYHLTDTISLVLSVLAVIIGLFRDVLGDWFKSGSSWIVSRLRRPSVATDGLSEF